MWFRYTYTNGESKKKRKEMSTTEIMAPSAVRRGARKEGASGVLVKF